MTVSVLVLFSVIVFISRIFFLNAGYGLDADAWRVVLASRHIRDTGEYMASRLPGYPLQEYFYSCMANAGDFAFNLITAIFSIIAFICCALISKELYKEKTPVSAICIIFVPVVYLNSTNSMDYLWGFSFMLLSLYATVKNRTNIAGILIGCAVGCRITYIPILLPFSIYVWQLNKSVFKTAFFIGIAVIIAGILYFPVMYTYRLDFFTYHQLLSPSVFKALLRATIHLWGKMGFIMILVLGITNMILFKKGDNIRKYFYGHNFIFILIVIIYFGLFVMLPDESAYLIPIIPFVVFLLREFLHKTLFYILCFFIVLSSFIDVNISGIESGAVIKNHVFRVEQMDYLDKSVQSIATIKKKSIIVAGSYLPKIKVMLSSEECDNLNLTYLIKDNKHFERLINAGYNIYYLSEVKQINKKVTGFDLSETSARSIPLSK